MTARAHEKADEPEAAAEPIDPAAAERIRKSLANLARQALLPRPSRGSTLG